MIQTSIPIGGVQPDTVSRWVPLSNVAHGSVFSIHSWWALVSYGTFMVTLGAFIFGQTTANAIFVDLMA